MLLLHDYFSLSCEIFPVCFSCSFCLCICPELPWFEQLSSAWTKWGNKEKSSLYFGSPSVGRFTPSVIYLSFDQMELRCPPSLQKNWDWSCETPISASPWVLPMSCLESHFFLCISPGEGLRGKLDLSGLAYIAVNCRKLNE